MAKFDLHLHSDCSDGSDTVQELVKVIVDNKLEIVALTDHDTVSGISEIRNSLPKNIKFIPGIELTSKAKDIKCHILGYGIDENNSALLDLIEKGKVLRRQKLETRIKFLKEKWNIELTPDELNWLYARKSVVKTHMANIIVNRGLADNNVDAMKKYLDGCKTGNTRFDGEEAIRVIKLSGGIPVWAHPLGGEGEEHLTKDAFLPKLETMISCGIQGLECYYSRYSDSEISFLKECANNNGLFITGGSDYHGTNKDVPIVKLNINGEPVDSKELNLKPLI
ncbi:PHP domain-containing protein [bacterium]|nr:PHP domain-containing protein [bacterium]